MQLCKRSITTRQNKLEVNRTILDINAAKNTIRFKYKNYHARGTDNMHRERSIPIPEFVRLFEQHILPKGFVKIRHYG